MNKLEALEFALTPSGDTKAAYIGEFKIVTEEHNPHYIEDFSIDNYDLSTYSDEALGRLVRESTSSTYKREHMIPWTTIKEIMIMIRNYANGLSTVNQDRI